MLGMLGTASLVAQTNVYSINAVGYINLTMAPGFNMIGCQLQVAGGNAISNVFNALGGGIDSCVVWKYVNNGHSGGAYESDTANSQSYSNGWLGNGTLTMNPGEAVWFQNNRGTNIPITFVGTVPQGTNTLTFQTGFSQACSPVPFSGDVVTNMGLTNYNWADTVWTWTPNGHGGGGYSSVSADQDAGSDSGYKNQWIGGDPQAAVGQGFWYQNNGGNPNGGSPTVSVVWTQVFSINP